MSYSEGVVKYQLDFHHSGTIRENIQQLNCCRSILSGLQLIGQHSQLYEGVAFGNLSQRSHLNQSQFIISATQTGHLAELTPNHYVCVHACDVARNSVSASGMLKPSSEALTHSMFYELDAAIDCVIHVHSAELWKYGLSHQYPCTDESVEYGSPQMANEVRRLFQSAKFQRSKTLIMAGHEDGVICFGHSIDQAASALFKLWATCKSH